MVKESISSWFSCIYLIPNWWSDVCILWSICIFFSKDYVFESLIFYGIVCCVFLDLQQFNIYILNTQNQAILKGC